MSYCIRRFHSRTLQMMSSSQSQISTQRSHHTLVVEQNWNGGPKLRASTNNKAMLRNPSPYIPIARHSLSIILIHPLRVATFYLILYETYISKSIHQHTYKNLPVHVQQKQYQHNEIKVKPKDQITNQISSRRSDPASSCMC